VKAFDEQGQHAVVVDCKAAIGQCGHGGRKPREDLLGKETALHCLGL
jgi:hypothetical protein